MECPVCGNDMLLRRTIEEYYRFRYIEDQGDRMWWSDEEIPDKAKVVKYEAVCDCGCVKKLYLTSEGFHFDEEGG